MLYLAHTYTSGLAILGLAGVGNLVLKTSDWKAKFLTGGIVAIVMISLGMSFLYRYDPWKTRSGGSTSKREHLSRKSYL